MALALGWVVLVLGLFVLNGVFRDERERGRQALADGRRAVEQYATRAFADALQTELRRASPQFDVAAEDPLVDDTQLLLIDHGYQVLPRTAIPGSERTDEAQAVIDVLATPPAGSVAPAADGDDPTEDRLVLVRKAAAAFGSERPQDAEAAVKEWLAHRANYAIPAATDVASALWLMERARDSGRASPDLLRAVLRDGIRGARSAQLPGLQRALLAHPEKFSRADFTLLRDRLITLSERSHVEYVDFRERAAQLGSEIVEGVVPLDAATLRPDGWYAEPAGEHGARGVRVNPAGLLAGIREAMVHRALIDASDALRFSNDALGTVSAIAVVLDSPRLAGAEAGLDELYRLKAGMLVVLAALGLGIVGLAVLAHQRKLRFVQLRSEFVSTVSHELKTPLSAIRVMAETLERKLANVPAAADYPSRIVSEADSLTRLVENILTFNRLDKGRWDARREEVPLDALIARVVEEASAHHSAQVSFTATGLEDAVVRADPELLRILLGNLVHNAIRYTRRSPVVLRVERVESPREELTLRIADNGVGIPRGSWETVFEEFRRLPNAALPAKGGSGLGLAICRRIMALHGGRISVADSSEAGTTFELNFPART